MLQLDAHTHVVQEWLRLPESRRRHATDAVAFAYRLLREEPDLCLDGKQSCHETVVNWLLPYLNKREAGSELKATSNVSTATTRPVVSTHPAMPD